MATGDPRQPAKDSEGRAIGGLASPSPLARPRRERRVKPRVDARCKGLSDRLHALKRNAKALEGIGEGYAYTRARIRPDLCLWGVPEGQGGGSPPLGLSIPRNLQNAEIEADAPNEADKASFRPARARNGLKGITKAGKKGVSDSLILLEEVRTRIAFWTVTLPDEDYEWLARLDAWSKFQTRIRDLLGRHLRSLGLPPMVVGVVEVGSARLKRTGKAMPHLHLAFYGWRLRGDDGQYLVKVSDMDDLVNKAAQYAGIPSRERVSCSRIEPVKWSIKSYLRKYMTKAVDVDTSNVEGEWLNCVPRQWWLRTKELKDWVEGHFFHLPPAFVAFVLQQRKRLEAMNLGMGGSSIVGWRKSMSLVEIAIERDFFRFYGPRFLAWALEWYAVWAHSPPAFEEAADGWLAKGGDCRQTARQHLPSLVANSRQVSSYWRQLAPV